MSKGRRSEFAEEVAGRVVDGLHDLSRFLLESGGNILHRKLKIGCRSHGALLGCTEPAGECNRQKDCQS